MAQINAHAHSSPVSVRKCDGLTQRHTYRDPAVLDAPEGTGGVVSAPHSGLVFVGVTLSFTTLCSTGTCIYADVLHLVLMMMAMPLLPVRLRTVLFGFICSCRLRLFGCNRLPLACEGVWACVWREGNDEVLQRGLAC